MDSTSASENAAAIQARSAFAMDMWSAMKDLDDFDYDVWSKWKLNVQLFLGLMDLDLALLQDKPTEPTETSSPEEKSRYEKWERSNRMSLLLMQSKMSNYIRSSVPKSDNAKEYLAGIETLVMKIENGASGFLMGKLLGMKYEAGEGNVVDHILTMSSLVNRLNAVRKEEVFPDIFLVELVLSRLPSEFDDLRSKRMADKEEWSLDDVISWCWRWEKYVRQENKANASSLGTKRGRMG